MNFNYAAKLTALFIFFYAVLFIISNLANFGLTAWSNNPMFWLMPFVGFFFVFVLMDYIDGYAKENFSKNLIFLPVFVVACYVSYAVVIYFYMGNSAQLNGQQLAVDFIGNAIQPRAGLAIVNFWERLLSSAFLLFIFSGIFGWVSKIAMERIGSASANKVPAQASALKKLLAATKLQLAIVAALSIVKIAIIYLAYSQLQGVLVYITTVFDAMSIIVLIWAGYAAAKAANAEVLDCGFASEMTGIINSAIVFSLSLPVYLFAARSSDWLGYPLPGLLPLGFSIEWAAFMISLSAIIAFICGAIGGIIGKQK